ncbi:MAG TPA: Re/Si-specific NAD(P)(+) transhydrogenase subunit alpha [Gemmatimonadales bacterium]|nr:Re/Si-specific NAD(P)(+) transhydrogenase subunit alpha [Gemmatimonadales bacterium]
MKIGVPKETAADERRVALVPETVTRLVAAGHGVAVARGAGDGAALPDAAYAAAGAVLAPDSPAVFATADVVVKVQRPSAEEAEALREASVLISFLATARYPDLVRRLAARRITALSLERVPRITRAQSMDALSSQATVAGYKAVVLGAAQLGKLLPMLTTAAGTLAPAKAFVLGAGVAGLQAIATARRLGAVVSAFDVRPAVKEQVESLGAAFVAAEAVSAAAEGKGGYATELADEQHQRELELIHRHIREMDLVITTALIPNRPAPRLITAAMVHDMKPGAVIVDLAAEAGGNCELTRPGETVTADRVTILGPLNLPATVPLHASQMLSRNLFTLLQHLVQDGRLVIDLNDEITGAMVVTHQGDIRSQP